MTDNLKRIINILIFSIIFLTMVIMGLIWAAQLGLTTDQISELPWPWYIARVSGLFSYLLMFILLVSGLTLTTDLVEKSKFLKAITRGDVFTIHKSISLLLIATLATHVFSLLFDKYLAPSLYQILIPFTFKVNTLWVGLGGIAFYIVLLTILVSLFPKIFSVSVWRFMHYATFVVFILSMIHGYMGGTDSVVPGIRYFYLVSILTIFILVLRRIILSFKII